MQKKIYTLVGPIGKLYESATPGSLGGYKRRKIYGQLNCPNALRWITGGDYVKHRLFFKDEETAKAAGFRPCSICMPVQYRAWKLHNDGERVND
jgi:hypothetical protein